MEVAKVRGIWPTVCGIVVPPRPSRPQLLAGLVDGLCCCLVPSKDDDLAGLRPFPRCARHPRQDVQRSAYGGQFGSERVLHGSHAQLHSELDKLVRGTLSPGDTNVGQQSGQENIRRIFETIKRLQDMGVIVRISWIPTDVDTPQIQTAKKQARHHADPEKTELCTPYRASSMTLSAIHRTQAKYQALPARVGTWTRQIDTAFPGSHTRTIYDALTATQARILAQLRTGMIRLRGYLSRIGAQGRA
ncbi:uncharacterized protein VDAG_02391 [Verticillium dahliae VdLs.17]|uniref:Uncharacterized protein n=1 Tax=Verticillium dahliae (strain VdLs.17 / ATCC MYA-4575 / FGSC 10137) TaxID=498257 RepID=G2WXQ9_VERDV|nr:uncharacterized protein VDAG_02391 [Verticillium dahliae VdLs.17]EGY20867.1 hypothetical protein VDAG_02391 [Verticillium dahliae VdLs.17]